MSNIAQMLGVSAIALLATACATATHNTAKLEAAHALAEAPSVVTTNQDDVVGRTEMAWGDRWTATNLFERAEADHDSVLYRYNLAIGYLTTGRRAEAAPLFRSLLVDGRYTRGVTINTATMRPERVNVAWAAWRQLALMHEPVFTYGPATSRAYVSASDASLIQGAPPIEAGKVSNAQARDMDDQAEAASISETPLP